MTRGQQRQGKGEQPPRRGYHQRRKEEQAAALQRELERAWLEPQTETPQREPVREARPQRYVGLGEVELLAAVGRDGMEFTQWWRKQ